MTAREEASPRRPPLGLAARTIPVVVKLSRNELTAIEQAVAAENVELGEDGIAREGRTTISSWLRDHGLDPLGLHPRQS